jgi:hypothetical protein
MAIVCGRCARLAARQGQAEILVRRLLRMKMTLRTLKALPRADTLSCTAWSTRSSGVIVVGVG